MYVAKDVPGSTINAQPEPLALNAASNFALKPHTVPATSQLVSGYLKKKKIKRHSSISTRIFYDSR